MTSTRHLLRACLALGSLGGLVGASGCTPCEPREGVNWDARAISGSVTYAVDEGVGPQSVGTPSCEVHFTAGTYSSFAEVYALLECAHGAGTVKLGVYLTVDFRTIPADGAPHELAPQSAWVSRWETGSDGRMPCYEGDGRIQGSVTVTAAAGSPAPYPKMVSSEYTRTISVKLNLPQSSPRDQSSTCPAPGPIAVSAVVEDSALHYEAYRTNESCE